MNDKAGLRSQIERARKTHSHWTLAQIGTHCGCSREYVRVVLRDAGLPTKSVNQSRADHRSPVAAWRNRFGNETDLTSHEVGAIGELQTAAWLMQRGWRVYRSMSLYGPCDLVAIRRDAVVRIEVRSAKRRRDGSLQYKGIREKDRAESLALVLPDGEVIMRPELPD